MDTRQVRWAVFLLVCLAPATVAQKVPDVRLDLGTPPGASKSEFPQIAAVGSVVYAVWEDHRNGRDDIYFNRSLDGGAIWLATEVRLNSGPAGSGESREPRMAISGSSIYVTWQDKRQSSASSFSDIYFNRSLDGGSTWLGQDIRLNVGSAPNTTSAVAPAIAASGSAVYVVWTDYRNKPSPPTADIYFNRSLDGGLTWLPEDVRLDVGTAPSARPSYGTQIAAAGSSVYVVWWEWRTPATSPNRDIFFNRSLDGGNTWLETDVRLDVGNAAGSTDSYGPQIVSSGSDVHVAWSEGQLAPSRDHDVLYNHSADSGATWLPSPIHLNVGVPTGASVFYWPSIAVSGSSVFVAWADDRNDPVSYTNDVYFNRSLNNGIDWLATDVRIDTGKLPGISNSLFPLVAVSASSAYVVWQDGRNVTNNDIYFNLALGFQPYGTGTPGSGGIVPTIAGSGSASIGGTLSIDLGNGLGGATGILVVGTGGPASIPVDGGLLLVQPPAQRVPIQLGGTRGIPGAGSTSVAFPIPYDLSLIGTRMNFQARFVDPGGARLSVGTIRSYSFTGGLEAWIL